MNGRSPAGDMTSEHTGGAFHVGPDLRILAVDAGAESLLGSPSAVLVNQHLSRVLGPLDGPLAPVQSALDGAGPAIARCPIVLQHDQPNGAVAAEGIFAVQRDGTRVVGMTVYIQQPARRPELRSSLGAERRAAALDDALIDSGVTNSAAEGIVEAIQRFGSRFDFVAMAAFRVVDGRLHRVELWNPAAGDAEAGSTEAGNTKTNSDPGARPAHEAVLVTGVFDEVLDGSGSGPQILETLPPSIMSALLEIPEAEQDAVTLLATRLTLPESNGLLVGARRNHDGNVSLNFNRTLRDLGWLITQLLARLEAEEALTVQLRLQGTLRTIATGFLSITPDQRVTALRESLWRFGTAVGVRRLMLWRNDLAAGTSRLEAQFAGPNWPIVPGDTDSELLHRTVGNQPQSAVIWGRDLVDLDLRNTRSEPALAPRDRLIMVPLQEGRHVLGYLLAVLDSHAPWSAAHTSGMDSLGSLLVSYMARSENEERFDRAFSDGAIPVTWRKPTGELLRCNNAFLDFLGQDSAYALLDSLPQDIVDADQIPAEQLQPPFDSDVPVEWPFVRADGSTAWGRIVSFNVRHGADFIVLSHIEDITALREQREELEHQATHDELTGLRNRRGLMTQLERLIGEDFGPAAAAVLLFDVDRFKVINDSLGHAAGDELLQILSDRLREALGPGDIGARLGGDEFVMVLRGPVDKLDVVATAEKLLDGLSGAVALRDHEVYTSISVGIAFPHPQDRDASDVLRHADAAMYEAKNAGRNRYELFDERTRDAVALKSFAEAEVRRALEREEFVAHFQPEYDLITGAIVGVEALVRWPHPTRGLVIASEIVPLAEETGLISELGALVLRDACAAAAEWKRRLGNQPFTLRVNISASQLHDNHIVDTVVAVLARTGLRAGDLCLEVTETALMKDPKRALSILNMLVHEVGVTIAVDDFGTGFSSLAYLRRLPVHTLKIDREFIHLLGEKPENTAIVKTIVALADGLSIETVAEGIEHESTVARLIEIGVTRGQGFYLARPQSRGEIDALLFGAATATKVASV